MGSDSCSVVFFASESDRPGHRRARALTTIRFEAPLHAGPIHYGQDEHDVVRRRLESNTPSRTGQRRTHPIRRDHNRAV